MMLIDLSFFKSESIGQPSSTGAVAGGNIEEVEEIEGGDVLKPLPSQTQRPW